MDMDVPGILVAVFVAILIAVVVIGIGFEMLYAAEETAGCNTVTQRILSQVADVVGTGAGIC